jgi:hypothetical protein
MGTHVGGPVGVPLFGNIGGAIDGVPWKMSPGSGTLDGVPWGDPKNWVLWKLSSGWVSSQGVPWRGSVQGQRTGPQGGSPMWDPKEGHTMWFPQRKLPMGVHQGFPSRVVSRDIPHQGAPRGLQ